MRVIIVIALIAVLGALASAGFFMLRKRDDDGSAGPSADKRMARALALRVGLSVALFVFILVSWKMGWISPSGIPTGR